MGYLTLGYLCAELGSSPGAQYSDNLRAELQFEITAPPAPPIRLLTVRSVRCQWEDETTRIELATGSHMLRLRK